jgi:hypothetical protein
MKMTTLSLVLALSSSVCFAGDLVRVMVGTQSYQCKLTPNLECSPLNEVQKVVIDLKKHGGGVQINDKERNLAGSIRTTLVDGKVDYGMTICATDSCSSINTSGGVNGDIDQVVSGQYKMQETTFNVLAFFITTGTLNEVQLKNRMEANLMLKAPNQD